MKRTARAGRSIVPCLAALPAVALSQVVRDGTIGPGTGVQPVGPSYVISQDMGARAGDNLFHSFDRFSLAEGERATFTGDFGIDNVIARVTGPGASFIDGVLGSRILGANLWLLNPRGVMFGPHASIDLTGSLNLSTASSLDFDDGAALRADVDGTPVLSVANPTTFRLLGGAPGRIEVAGAQLRNPHGFALRSGVIEISDGGGLAASAVGGYPGGDIELFASRQISLIDTPPDQREQTFGTLDSRTFGATDAGDIRLEAPVIELVDGGSLRSVTVGSGAGGDISIVASERFALYGESPTGLSPQINSIGVSTGGGGDVYVATPALVMDDAARLWSATSGPGAGGNIAIDAGSIAAEASSQIYSLTTGAGRGGDVAITASEEITLGGLTSEFDATFGASIGATSGTGATGQGGTVRIESPVIVLIDGGRIDSSAFGAGDGGDVYIEANSITVSGHGSIASFIGAVSLGSGDAGDLRLHTARLVLDSGGSIVSDAFGSGRGGDIVIVATESVTMSAGDAARPRIAELDDQGDDMGRWLAVRAPAPPADRLYSGFIAANARSDGAAGSIAITAPSVRLTGGAAVTSSTTGSADGGRIVITADELVLDGEVVDDRAATQIRAESGFDARHASGNGGQITLIVGRLEVTNGASISSSSFGVGDAGNIRIAARDGIRIDDGRIATEALEASGGNISLSAGDGIFVTDGEISTSVMSGSGRGGNITIGADPEYGVDGTNRVVLNDSRIVAEADAGSGGTIRISSNVFMASSNSVVDASAATGVDGQVRIEAVDMAADAPVENLGVHYVDAASLLRQQCAARDGRFSVRSRRGQPASPEEMLLAFDAVDRGVTPGVAQYAAATGAASLLDGELMLRSGRGEDAAALFRDVVRSAVAAGDAAAEADALRGLGQSLQARGLYADSVPPLRSALALAKDIDDRGRASAALVNLGNAQLALGETSAADASLTRAVVLARQLDDPPLLATAVNAVGNKYVSGADFERALATFEESAELARRAGDHSLELRALANAARAALRAGEPTRAQALMAEAGASISVLPATPGKVQLLVHLGRSHAELAAASPALREPGLLAAFESLSTAEALARSMPGQARALSFALGNLAALYAQEHRVPEALYLNARALAAAEEAGAADAAYRWHWQEGRLQWALGEPTAAIGAYRRAVDLLEETRQGGLSRYGATSNHFREAIAPVYLDLVDALLRASEMVGYPEDEALLFEEARQTMEQLKAAELRDYFRDECAAEWQDVFQSHWPATAIVYPIVLADRLELLVSLPEGIERHRVAVSEEDLTRAVHTLRRQLEERAPLRQYRTTAMELYEWLVAPYAGALADAGVETLVFVPDGALRSIPMSALHDGEDFLVARYATVTAASLALTDPRPLHASHHALLAGVSESVAGFPGLAHVPRELNSIRSAYGGMLLLDEDFTRARFEDAMAQRQPAIVHIASHGQFTGDPATSFLLTHDGALSMSELEQSVSARRIPLELLVLSACQTAAGDDRAALGLAGVSLRAGAHSAVGSLWNVSDAATALLFEAFYGQLREPDTSRAAAMRAAQLALVESERFSHPFFWSGFLLINSWL